MPLGWCQVFHILFTKYCKYSGIWHYGIHSLLESGLIFYLFFKFLFIKFYKTLYLLLHSTQHSQSLTFRLSYLQYNCCSLELTINRCDMWCINISSIINQLSNINVQWNIIYRFQTFQLSFPLELHALCVYQWSRRQWVKTDTDS